MVFFNYGSSMIRTTVSLFVLDFINMGQKNERLRRVVSYFPFANYYVYNVLFVHDCFQDIRQKIGRGELKGANLQSKLQFLGDLLNYVHDLLGCNNRAVSQINYNVFLKLFLFQICNDFVLLAHKDEGDFRISNCKSFVYLIKMLLEEFSQDKVIVSFITLMLFRPRIHRDLFSISSENTRSETFYIKDKKFPTLFDETDKDIIEL